MKVGVLQFFSWPERRVPAATVYERALQRIEVMDRTGYDAVWLAEHHFSSFSICPSVHLMGMHVADRTTNLRIGMGVSLAATYHPLRLAEEVALLDVLSGGRVNWGAGRGFQRLEFETFGVRPEESYPRFREHVEVVLAAWTQDRVTYHGDYVHYDDIELLPKPLQRPHPPTWLAATSTDAITWTAQRGFDLMLDPHSTYAQIAAKWELHQQVLAANGHPTDGRVVPMARLLAVADTDAEAADVARAGAEWTIGAYVGTSTAAPPPDPLMPNPMSAADPVQRYVDDVIIHGSPSRVIDEVQRLEDDMHLGYLLCAPLSHRSFELFTEKVMPKL
jgi:alkanesulfonate monooxygenase SsuD/methylene tetrahydromethanopterin reductase-like flavin-dependent oxidoreductase (luciferase family)